MREAQESDIDGIVLVYKTCIETVCSTYYSEDIVQKWLEAEHDYSSWIKSAAHFLVIANRDDNIFAFACVGRLSPDLHVTSMEFELYKLYVSPAVGRRGIGRKLLKELEQRVRNDGGNGITLRSSLNAAPFYEACGYTCTLQDEEHIARVGEALIPYKPLEKTMSSRELI